MNKGNEGGFLQSSDESICQIKKISEIGRKESNSVNLKRTLITKIRKIYRRLIWAFASFLRESYTISGKEKKSPAKRLPPPIPAPGDIAQKFLQEGRK